MTNGKAPIFALVGLGLVLALLMAFGLSKDAQALSAPLSTAKDWSVTCTTTPTAISDGNINSFVCDNNSVNSVFIGGPDVDATGYCISKDTASCSRRDIPADFRGYAAYCRTTVGTQVINCLGGHDALAYARAASGRCCVLRCHWRRLQHWLRSRQRWQWVHWCG